MSSMFDILSFGKVNFDSLIFKAEMLKITNWYFQIGMRFFEMSLAYQFLLLPVFVF